MKKTLAILLALVMILSLATTAFAASITITPPTVPEGATESGITYTAYKIFDATITYKEGSTTEIDKVSYTIDSTSAYYSTIVKYSNLNTTVDKTETEYFKLTQVGTSTTYVVEKLDAYTDAAADTFAEILKGVTATAAGSTNTKTSSVITGLSNGYYLVTSSVGSDLVLDTIGDITVTTKNEYPTLDKKVNGETDDVTTANKGDILTFTIDVSIPTDATGEIVVHDKMTGLEYQSMTEVSGITETKTPTCEKGCAVHFTLTADYVNANKGKTITITYTAKVTADTANNEAWLVDDTYTSTSDDTKVYSTDIVINKYYGSNATDAATKLAGAKFVLYKNVDAVGTEGEEGYVAAHIEYYKLVDGAVKWVTALDQADVVTTDSEGKATFADLADGTYYLLETEAPTGYNKLTDPVEVKVAAETEGEPTTVNNTAVTANVVNKSGSELPSTGGIGTTLFYILGGVLVVGAAVVLVTKKRMSAEA